MGSLRGLAAAVSSGAAGQVRAPRMLILAAVAGSAVTIVLHGLLTRRLKSCMLTPSEHNVLVWIDLLGAARGARARRVNRVPRYGHFSYCAQSILPRRTVPIDLQLYE